MTHDSMSTIQIPRRFAPNHWGGTETVVLESCKQLIRMGHDAAIYTSKALCSDADGEIAGVPVRRFDHFYPYWGLSAEARRCMDEKAGNLFSFSLLRALRKVSRLDLIHLHTGNRLGGIGRSAARARKIPYVISIHGGACDASAETIRSWAEPAKGTVEWGKALGWWVGSRRVLDDAAAIICVGEEEQRLMSRRFPSKRVIHLPNGVDAERFSRGDGKRFRQRYGIPDGAHVILTVGRIDPQKDQAFAVSLLPHLLKLRNNVHLVLIGHVTDAAYAGTLEAGILKAGVNDRVTLIKGLPADSQDLADAYHAAELFLLPSVHEPFGIVVLEAWAAGLPVVASRVGGIPSFVAEGQDGLLFEPGNERQCMEALQRSMSDPALSRGLAENGLKKATEKYGWSSIARQLEMIYRDVIRENPLR